MSNCICDKLKSNINKAIKQTLGELIEQKLESGDEFQVVMGDDETVVTFKDGDIYGINNFKRDAYSNQFLADVLEDIKSQYGL